VIYRSDFNKADSPFARRH